MDIILPVAKFWSKAANWIAAKRACWAAQCYPVQNSLEPRFSGRAERGDDLLAGRFLINGQFIEQPQTPIWQIVAKPSPARIWAHGFEWLADLGTLGTPEARNLAVQWVDLWLNRFGDGAGPAWCPERAGRRLIHMIMQAEFMEPAQSETQRRALHKTWHAHYLFLCSRGHKSPKQIARIENAVALSLLPIILKLPTSKAANDAPQNAIGQICAYVNEKGVTASRDAATLLYTLELALMVQDILAWHEAPLNSDLSERITAMAANLRSLRHSTGHLTRMHASGRGSFGRLDHALDRVGSASNEALTQEALGFIRLAAGRSTLIIDAALPPKPTTGPNSASLLGVEFSSGRDVIFTALANGARLAKTGKNRFYAPEAFSTVSLAPPHKLQLPNYVPTEHAQIRDGFRFEGAHDGWAASSGLTHLRQLNLAPDGLSLRGEDQLLCLNKTDHERFSGLSAAGVGFTFFFHLHPKCNASMNAIGTEVTIQTPSGYIWQMHVGDDLAFEITTSTWQDASHLISRPSQTILINGLAQKPLTRITWALKRLEKSTQT